MDWARMVPELTVSNFAVSLDFYTRVLGFNLAFSRGEFAYLERDGVQLMLEPAPPSWPVAELVLPFGRGVNFQMEWDDVTALRNALVAQSYPIYRDLEERWRETGEVITGSREFLIQDPNGYLLRFAQSLGERAKS